MPSEYLFQTAAPLYSSFDFRAYATNAAAVTGSTADAPAGKPIRAIKVCTAGTVIVTRIDGESVTLPSTFDGDIWPIQCKEITGGTGTNIVLFW